MTLFDPLAVQPGDIIFAFGSGSRAAINLTGQSIMRLRGILRAELSAARSTHVMMGVGPGLVIHADGTLTRIQPLMQALEHALPPNHSANSIRVMRPADPPLSEFDGIALVRHARAFLQQTYSFIPGRRTNRLGQLLHRRRHLTHPFCSELIATAYTGIGRRLAKRPPDRVLPLDLELYCTQPAWSDVTESYLAPAPLAAETRQSLSEHVNQVLAKMDQFMVDSSVALEELAEVASDEAMLKRTVARRLSHASLAVAHLCEYEWDSAKRQIAQPVCLFSDLWPLSTLDLTFLPGFYQDIELGLSVESLFAGPLRKLHPDSPDTSPIYEGLPSIATIRAQELNAFRLRVGATLLRLESLFLGSAIAFGIPSKDISRFSGLTESMVQRVLSAMPTLTRERMLALVEKTNSVSVLDADLQRLCEQVIRLHAMVSALRDHAATSPSSGGSAV